MTLLHRFSQADLEVRGDGRTVYGLAVPFDTPTEIREHGRAYTELFRQGAFARTLNAGHDRIKLLVNHDRIGRLPIGKALTLREDRSGLVGEFRVSKTGDGDEALELVRDGVLDAFSVGFTPIQQNDTGTLVERTEVKLSEVSLVAFPAYTDAVVSGVRAASELRTLLDAAHKAGVTDLRTLLDELADPGTSTNGPATTTQDPDASTPAVTSSAARNRRLRLLALEATP
jgi:HK97 family phage prohead protease